MDRRRILVITNRIPFPLKDGGNMAMHAMIEGYQQEGLDVFLFSMNTSRHYFPIEELPPLYQKIKFDSFDIDTEVKILPSLKNFLLSKKPNQVDRFFNKEFDKKLRKIIEDFEPEIIQIESIYLSYNLPSIKAVSQAKIIIRLHNIEHQIWENLAAEATNSFKKYYLKDLASRIKKFELNAWKDADLLIPITDTDAKIVSDAGASTNMHVAPFGIDMKKIKQKAIEENWNGYHIGAMDWMPNAEAITWFLENVWKELHKDVPDFEFHFAGRNMPASFKKYQMNGVVCAGEVADAKEFIADKKILIVPLQAGSGIRVKIMEAIAAEKLIISTAIGMQGINNVEAGKHFLLAETSEDFIRQIKWALDNKDKALQIAKNGADLIKTKYDQQKIMHELVQKINSLI